MKTICVAAVQMCSQENRDDNLKQAQNLMEKAVRAGAHLIALPENFSFVGQDDEKIGMAEDLETGPSVTFLKTFALEHAVAIIGGSIPLKASIESKVTNTCLAFAPTGQLIARYDKIHLFDISLDESHTFKESKYIEAGHSIVTVELFGHVMGLSICYDLRFPELYRSLAFHGAEVLFVPSAFTYRTGKDHWEILLRARAIENQCYVIAPAQFGQHNAQRMSFGNSMIINPWGHVLKRCPKKKGVIVCELDFNFLAETRKHLPSLNHAMKRRFLY